jgi:hypothetical protein
LTERNVLRTQVAAGGDATSGNSCLKIELNDQQRRAVGRALVERRARLIESTGDTTLTRARQRAGSLELSAIASVLRKLRRLIRRPERAAKAKFLANAPQELKALSC